MTRTFTAQTKIYLNFWVVNRELNLMFQKIGANLKTAQTRRMRRQGVDLIKTGNQNVAQNQSNSEFTLSL